MAMLSEVDLGALRASLEYRVRPACFLYRCRVFDLPVSRRPGMTCRALIGPR